METCDVAIIGAGPYGLSAAAHLSAINGLEVRVFGEVMSFWEQHMPVGMCLRSPLEGSHLSDPESALNLHAFSKASGEGLACPFALDRFVAYGKWFGRKAVPHVDPRKVVRLERSSAGFRLSMNDGEIVCARRVVVATGILTFAYQPPQFDGLPTELVSHTCRHRDLSIFAGKQVLILGAGQSALESAALLHEAGAFPEVIVRNPALAWSWGRPWLHREPLQTLLYAPADVGPAGFSHIIARPGWYVRMPRSVQDWLAPRTNPPAGAAWLKPRLEKVPFETGRTIVSARPKGKQLTVTLDDGQARQADHLLLGTGYLVDVSRYPFFDQGILSSIAQHQGFPILRRGFESSVPGLHFLGAPAAWSFGPLMRFVAGTDFAARSLASSVRKSGTVKVRMAKKATEAVETASESSCCIG